MKSKGQINQVFIIIFSLLIIGLLVVFAAKGIGGIFDDKCNADYIKFQNDLNQLVFDGKDYGAVLQHRLLAPCDYSQLCVIDSKYRDNDFNGVTPDVLQTVMKNSVSSNGITNNVFLFDGKEVKLVGFIEELQIDGETNYVCIPRSAGRFTFITEGKGRFIQIIEENS